MNRVFILDKICLNVDNETDAQNLIRQGAKEIKDLSIFKGYESLVSPTNTVVNDDGSITFTAPKEKSLDELKSEKLAELSAQALAFEENVNKDMSFISSVGGYHINGDRRTRSNLEDLITYSATDIIQFRDYDNTMREVTKDQLKVILKEHVINGQNLYYQKWAFEAKINACTTIEELNAIEIKFTMQDFSKEGVVADE